MFKDLCALLLSDRPPSGATQGIRVGQDSCQRDCNSMLKKGTLKLGEYLEAVYSDMNSFSKFNGCGLVQRSQSCHQVGHPLSSPGKSLFSKIKSCYDFQKHVSCKTRVGVGWGFLVGSQLFGILQVVFAVCLFRGSLAMDLYALGLAAVDLSLLETLTVGLQHFLWPSTKNT